jgi:uncharacterized protein (DUF1501 family)
MRRRDFLRNGAPAALLPFLLGGFNVRTYGRSKVLESLIAAGSPGDRVLVLIQLNGGNDGLNTVIPLDQYGALASARGNIAIPESSVLRLTDATGLHPAMTGLRSLYDAGRVNVVQGVTYPNPNKSHFRGTDIWLTASDADQTLSTGWLGRYLDQVYPGFPEGYPNEVAPDPLAIQIGSVVSTGLQGPSGSLGMAITSPTTFYQLLTGGVDEAPDTPAGHELTFIRQVAQQTSVYAERIKAAAEKVPSQSPLYPPQGTNKLADQLKIVAQLIAGGLKTRIYIVNLGGFDTHAAQVDQVLGTEYGNHADLLGKLSAAILAFMEDLKALRADDRVLGMTFSEFGRRIKSNASFGTDHGEAAPMFIFGKWAKHGITGANPVIPYPASGTDNLAMQFDFRQVYASVLGQWFGAPQAMLEAVLLKNFQALPLVGASRLPRLPIVNREGPAQSSGAVPARAALRQNYPNPFNPSTTIAFASAGDPVSIRVYDALGREAAVLVEGTPGAGEFSVTFDASALPAGVYFCRMRSGAVDEVRRMNLVK